MSFPILQQVDGVWLLDTEVRPVRFWPYETFVTGPVLRMPLAHMDSLDRARRTLVTMFTAAGIKAEVDNKTVFEVDDRFHRRWCLGFYDLEFTLGTSCRRSW